MMNLKWGFPSPAPPLMGVEMVTKCGSFSGFRVVATVNGGCGGGGGDGFPTFLPKEVEKIKDPFARTLAQRIERLPVKMRFSEICIMSSCVKPLIKTETNPVVLLHCFDSSCLEWSYVYPLFEKAGIETWAIDVLGWGFSNLETLPPCDAASKRNHLYELWKSYIKRPMILVGPSLGAAVAIDFTVNYPEAVEKLVLINGCVYDDIGLRGALPEIITSAAVSLLKSIPLRLYINKLAFNEVSLSRSLDWTNVGRLHCLLPWWKDSTLNFISSGGYNIKNSVKQVTQRVLVIRGEDDQIVRYKQAVRLYCELPDAIIRFIPNSGHLPHVERPTSVAKLIITFVLEDYS